MNRGPETGRSDVLADAVVSQYLELGCAIAEARRLRRFAAAQAINAASSASGHFVCRLDGAPEVLFTENETNTERLWGWRGQNAYLQRCFP